jgi:hypothetical protein
MSKARTASGAANFRIKIVSVPLRAYVGRRAKKREESSLPNPTMLLSHKP